MGKTLVKTTKTAGILSKEIKVPDAKSKRYCMIPTKEAILVNFNVSPENIIENPTIAKKLMTKAAKETQLKFI